MYVDCQRNEITTLSLAHCVQLKHLQCSHNKLVSVKLNPAARLGVLNCSGINHRPVIKGDPEVTNLGCCVQSMLRESGAKRQRLVRLNLRNSNLTTVMDGFKDLEYLRCKFGRTSGGMIDLTECTSVELDCLCEENYLPITAQEHVYKLTLTQLGSSRPDFFGFDQLQELNLTVHKQTLLEIFAHDWGCWGLRKLNLAAVSGSACPLRTLDLSQCRRLQHLSCDGFPNVTSLDLLECASLVSVSCKGSSIQGFDVSASPNLTTLDLSHSLRLKYVLSRATLVHVTFENCGELQPDKEVQEGVEFLNWTVVPKHKLQHTKALGARGPDSHKSHSSGFRRWMSRLFNLKPK